MNLDKRVEEANKRFESFRSGKEFDDWPEDIDTINDLHAEVKRLEDEVHTARNDAQVMVGNLEADNARLRELCGEAYRTFKSVSPHLPIIQALQENDNER